MCLILRNGPLQRLFAEENYAVQAFTADTTYKALSVTVLLRVIYLSDKEGF